MKTETKIALSGMIITFIVVLIMCYSMDANASKNIDWGFNIFVGFCNSAIFLFLHKLVKR